MQVAPAGALAQSDCLLHSSVHAPHTHTKSPQSSLLSHALSQLV
jgi:hypothetical protein